MNDNKEIKEPKTPLEVLTTTVEDFPEEIEYWISVYRYNGQRTWNISALYLSKATAINAFMPSTSIEEVKLIRVLLPNRMGKHKGVG
jgi:hypothetical protein